MTNRLNNQLTEWAGKMSTNDHVNISKEMVVAFAGVLLQKFCRNTDGNHKMVLTSG